MTQLQKEENLINRLVNGENTHDRTTFEVSGYTMIEYKELDADSVSVVYMRK